MTSSVGTSAPLHRSRQTVVLDLFVTLKMHDDAWADETELHLGQSEAFRDLFDLMQPRTCLEDLLHAYLAPAGMTSPYDITFAPRHVGLVTLVGPSRRTIGDVERARADSLVVAAKCPKRGPQDILWQAITSK